MEELEELAGSDAEWSGGGCEAAFGGSEGVEGCGDDDGVSWVFPGDSESAFVGALGFELGREIWGFEVEGGADIEGDLLAYAAGGVGPVAVEVAGFGCFGDDARGVVPDAECGLNLVAPLAAGTAGFVSLLGAIAEEGGIVHTEPGIALFAGYEIGHGIGLTWWFLKRRS